MFVGTIRAASEATPHSRAIVQSWLRRIRGAIGMGLAWGVAWGAVGSVPRWLFGFNTDAPLPLIFGVLGFLAGVAFFGLLMLTERHRSFDELSVPRFAGWGTLSGLLLSAVFAKAASLAWGDVLVIAPTFAAACAVCATGSLVLARRAVGRDLLDGRGQGADAELTDRTSDVAAKRS